MKERNYGIDIFKMFAMYLVCVLHVLGQGGVLTAVDSLSVNYAVAWSLELIAYVAVDCFAIASGYVAYKASFKPRKLINLWLTTFFYGVVIILVFKLTDAAAIGFDEVKQAVLPITHGNTAGYWYVTAYAVTFMLMPFYNYLLKNLDKKKLTYLVVLLVVLLSVIPAIRQMDYFGTKDGYSFLWISALYFIGAYLSRFKVFEKVKTSKILLLLLFTFAVVCTGHYLLNYYSVSVLNQDISSQADVLSNVYGKHANYLKTGIFANYTFPTTILASVLLTILFSRIKVKNGFLQSRLSSYAPLVFSVYLIHTNKLVFENVLAGLFESYASFRPILMALAVLGTALAIYVICIMIDMLRFELFKLLRVDKLCEFIEIKLRSFWNGLFDKKEGATK